MSITEAIENLKMHAQDYAAPSDLREAVRVVAEWHERLTAAARYYPKDDGQTQGCSHS